MEGNPQGQSRRIEGERKGKFIRPCCGSVYGDVGRGAGKNRTTRGYGHIRPPNTDPQKQRYKEKIVNDPILVQRTAQLCGLGERKMVEEVKKRGKKREGIFLRLIGNKMEVDYPRARKEMIEKRAFPYSVVQEEMEKEMRGGLQGPRCTLRKECLCNNESPVEGKKNI